MKDCLKCKNLDTSDIPNLFCNLSCELVNETEFRYCPKDPKSVVKFIEKLEDLHKQEVEELKSEIKELKIINAEIFDDNKKLEKENEQLKEKDKEIAFLKENNTKLYERIEKIKLDYEKRLLSSIDAYQRVILKLKEKLKINTKQVCEKIKNVVNKHNGLIYGFIAKSVIREILNQVGRGEM